MAKAPEKQTPGVYKRRIGDAMVTVINDGFLDIPFEILRGTELDDMKGLMQATYRSTPPRLTVNAFAIETGKNTVLVDVGGGSTTVYSMGLLLENLESAGFAPTDFDTVLLTHIHPDHSSGLMGPSGEVLFPHAEIVVNEDELNFWSDPSLRDGRSAAATPYLDSADMVIEAYREQFRPSRAGSVLPHISLIALPGHTPGHSGYEIESAGETLVMWGDTVHVPEIQIPRPQVTSEYDVDEGLAHANRRRIFEYAAKEGHLVTGGHLHLPAFAHIIPDGQGFRLVPEPWAVVV